jgi:hypothetical protein
LLKTLSLFKVESLQKSKDFSNGLKNPIDKASASVGFFYPLEIFFLAPPVGLRLIRVGLRRLSFWKNLFKSQHAAAF